MTVRSHLLPVLVGAFLLASCPPPHFVPIQKETTVFITFTGICTLYDPCGWKGIQSSLTMLLVNAEVPHAVFRHGHAHRHVPFILFNQGYLHPSQPTNHLFEAVDPKEKKYWRYELRGEEVFLDSKTHPEPAKLWYSLTGDTEKKDCPTNDFQSLHWLPRMTHVRNKKIGVRAPMVEKPRDLPYGVPHPDPARVAARIVINAGLLAVKSFMSEAKVGREAAPILWEFKQREEDRDGHKQAMAQELVWCFTIKKSTLTLKHRRFAAPTMEANLLTFQAVRGRIELTIGNTLPEDILPGGHHANKARADVHFALYDRFVSDQEIPAVIPFPVDGDRDRCERAVPRSVDGLNCGPNRLP